MENNVYQQTEELLSSLQSQLRTPKTLSILVSSPSPVTLSLLNNILSSFEVISVPSPLLTIEQLTQAATRGTGIDFVILDHFNQQELEEIAKVLDMYPSLSNTKAIHLYTPTPFTLPLVGGVLQKPNGTTSPAINGGSIDLALASATGFASTHSPERKASVLLGRIVRMNKPPRRGRLLQLLAKLKEIPMPAEGFRGSQIQQALESLEAAQTLHNTANVLIAEGKLSLIQFAYLLITIIIDNPIANKLLVKQLEKYDIHVIATADGSEAVREWERHPIGFFNFALFDHRMSSPTTVYYTFSFRLTNQSSRYARL
jgi:CheY-like chemotaxis protein